MNMSHWLGSGVAEPSGSAKTDAFTSVSLVEYNYGKTRKGTWRGHTRKVKKGLLALFSFDTGKLFSKATQHAFWGKDTSELEEHSDFLVPGTQSL